jgi:predicted aconitase
MKFKALIDGVHFDPKKGTVKIVLIGASHVSLDELTTIAPKDESILVTLESEQTKIEVFSLLEPGSLEERDVGLPIRLEGEEAAERLKDAAERLREGDVDVDEIEEVDEIDETTGGGQGGII